MRLSVALPQTYRPLASCTTILWGSLLLLVCYKRFLAQDTTDICPEISVHFVRPVAFAEP